MIAKEFKQSRRCWLFLKLYFIDQQMNLFGGRAYSMNEGLKHFPSTGEESYSFFLYIYLHTYNSGEAKSFLAVLFRETRPGIWYQHSVLIT
jgi:hypothetical protein